MNKPNPKSKTKDLHWKASSIEEEQMIVSFKKLALQDANRETTPHSLFKEALSLLFVKHHLDLHGNPQRQLQSFQGEQKQLIYCRCGRTAEKHGVNLQSGMKRDLCLACFSKLPMRYDRKVWRFTNT